MGQPVKVASGDSAVVDIPVDNFEKQVLNLAAFDKTGRLLSERLFLNDVGESYHVNVKTDQQVYGQRKKVTVTLNITDGLGKPILANLSVAASAKDHFDKADYRDILNTWYLKFVEGGNYIAPLSDLGESNIDALMISKNWRQYYWDNVLTYQPKGKFKRLINTDGVVGYVKSLNKKPVKLKELYVMSKKVLFSVPLNPENYFFISSAGLLRDRSEKEYIMMNTDLVYQYEIHLLDYAGDFDTNVSATNALFIPEKFNSLARYEEVRQALGKGMIQLKEVKINSGSSTRSDEINGIKIYQSKDCSDMVCMYNNLNCVNHPGCCFAPIDGGIYRLNGKPIVYRGCVDESINAKTHIPLKLISIPKAFYLPDYDKEPSYEPELHTTVYWNPNLNTDNKGNATFTFFTSDITGDFVINAQGIDARVIKPLSGKAVFKVK